MPSQPRTAETPAHAVEQQATATGTESAAVHSEPSVTHVTVPTPRQSRTSLAREIAQAFKGPIKRPRVGIFYQLGLLVVAAMMILLPLIYIALIGCAGYGVYYHIVNHASLASFEDGSGGIHGVLVYVAPVIIGGILLLFMIKPLLARRAMVFDSITIRREEESVLFAFVENICEVVGAPKPTRIEIDAQVNASAGFDRGLWRFLRGKLVLTIGLPLVQGLSARQLAGVLAHEFGHFSQSIAMRLSYIIRIINAWFARVVYERDQWDERLVEWSQSGDGRIRIIFYLARLMIWIVRKILWALMMIGHGISCFMSRQMEYNADQYEIRLAGSDSFISTARRITFLSVAFQGAIYDLQETWRDKRLGDDVAALIVDKAKKLPPKVREQIDEMIRKQRTGVFDTHPSDRARIRKAEKAAAPGVFHFKKPATVLIGDYDRIARLTSIAYYKAVIGDAFQPTMLVASEEIAAERDKALEQGKALARYSQKVWSASFPPSLEETIIPKPANFKQAANDLVAARKNMKATVEDTAKACKALDDEKRNLAKYRMVLELVRAGMKIRAKDFGVASANKPDLKREIDQTTRTIKSFQIDLSGFRNWAQKRMFLALQLLHHPNVRKAMGDRYVEVGRVETLCAALKSLNNAHNLIDSLQEDSYVLYSLLRAYDGEDQNMQVAILKYIRACNSHQERLSTMLKEHEYPFEHSADNMTLGRFVVESVPHTEDMAAVEQIPQTLDNYYTLLFRASGRLAQIAENVETALGLKPWPDPPEEEEEEENN